MGGKRDRESQMLPKGASKKQREKKQERHKGTPEPSCPSERSIVHKLRSLLLHGGSEADLKEAIRWLIDGHLMTFPVQKREKDALCADVRALYAIKSKRIRLYGMRAFVLLSLYLEEDVAYELAACSTLDRSFVKDIRERILPVLVPLYVDNLAQRPDRFVELCSNLHRRWPSEPLHHLHSNPLHTNSLQL